MDKIDSELSGVKDLITPEYIYQEIMTELIQKYPDIETALENYQQVADSLGDIENSVMSYASDTIVNASNNIDRKLEEYSNWDNLDNSHDTYIQECNYYEKAEEYYYPEIRKSEYLAIIGTAISMYLKEEETNQTLAYIAMAKYLSEES